MKITNRKRVEDCFDGSLVFEYYFEEPWCKNLIMSLSKIGKLHYFGDFPRPFFRMLHKGGLHIKGVEGQNKCRIVFPLQEVEKQMNALDRFFSTL